MLDRILYKASAGGVLLFGMSAIFLFVYVLSEVLK